MANYEELKAELQQIAGLLEKLPESVRGKAFDLLVSTYLGKQTEQPRTTHDLPPESPSSQNPGGTAKVRRKAKAESYKLDGNLNLRGGGDIPPFKQFVDQKKPDSNQEFNTVAAYYLIRKLKLEKPTLDQLYTCYDEAKRRPPEFLRQSVIDTKNKKGWMELAEDDSIGLPHRGVTFVEHDLPKPSEPA